MIDAGTLLAGIALCVGGVVWLVRLEGRIDKIGDVNRERYGEIIRRLDRIERKQDAE